MSQQFSEFWNWYFKRLCGDIEILMSNKYELSSQYKWIAFKYLEEKCTGCPLNALNLHVDSPSVRNTIVKNGNVNFL